MRNSSEQQALACVHTELYGNNKLCHDGGVAAAAAVAVAVACTADLFCANDANSHKMLYYIELQLFGIPTAIFRQSMHIVRILFEIPLHDQHMKIHNLPFNGRGGVPI